MERVAEQLLAGPKAKGTLRQRLRAVETLEMIGSPEARAALEQVAAKGAPAEVREEAAKAVARLPKGR